MQEQVKITRKPAMISSVDKRVWVFGNLDNTSSCTSKSNEAEGCSFISENNI